MSVMEVASVVLSKLRLSQQNQKQRNRENNRQPGIGIASNYQDRSMTGTKKSTHKPMYETVGQPSALWNGRTAVPVNSLHGMPGEEREV